MQDKLQYALDLCNKKKFDEALPILEEITKNDPNNSEAWRTLAQLHWLHHHNADKAYDELIEALKCDPQNLWALILMGNLLTRKKNDVEHAKQYYDKVLEYHPDNAIAINNIGATFMERKDFEGALPYLQKALKLDDTYVNSYYGLALCYYKLGKLEESFNTCHQGAIKSVDRPENPTVRQELLKLYLTVAKDLSSKTNYINIWKGIKDELEAVDHVNIRFEETKDLQVLAKLEYAPLHGAKEHIVKYNPEKEFVDHMFVHEMMHLKMNQQATLARKGKAVISSESTRSAFNRKFLRFMQKTHKQLSPSSISDIMEHLADGLCLQLMNCPLDLFVERMIYTTYKDMRPIQLISLYHQEMNNIEGLKKANEEGFFPKEIVKVNKVMNIATSMNLKDMYGIDIIKEYRPTKQEYDQAKDLFDEFKAYLNTYHPGDEYEMMEYFVQSLDMEDLIDIRDESEITNRLKNQRQSDILEELSQQALSAEDVDVANADFALKHQDGANPAETMMMSMYMLGAMEYFDTLDPQEVHRIALEIAMVGVTGIHPEKKYSIKSIPDKEFGGYELLAYYYVSWARAIPDKLDDLGLPFSKAYESALQLYNGKHKN